MPPHRSFPVLDGLWAVLAGADADGVLDADDKDLAVADFTLAGAAGDCELVDHRVDDLRPRLQVAAVVPPDRAHTALAALPARHAHRPTARRRLAPPAT